MLDVLLVAAALWIGPVDRVVDGDTFVMRGERIRLAAIDAPELSEPGGPDARDALAGMVDGRRIRCVMTGRGFYGRRLASCWLLDMDREGGINLSAELVRAGRACVVGAWLRDAAPDERRLLVELDRCPRR